MGTSNGILATCELNDGLEQERIDFLKILTIVSIASEQFVEPGEVGPTTKIGTLGH